MRALFEITKRMRLETAPLAIRGARLSLTRDTYRDATATDQPITGEHLTLTEVDDDNLVRTSIRFDPDDIDAAVRELDARYVAGEAAAYSDTWSKSLTLTPHSTGTNYPHHTGLGQSRSPRCDGIRIR